MKGLTLILDNNSVELLASHTRLTNQKSQVNEDIVQITGLTDTNQFSQLGLPVDYAGELNKITTKVDSYNNEQHLLAQQISEASQQIASLRQKSKTFSILLIGAVLVIVIVIALL